MADEPTSSGWLPPTAPGGQPAPRFEPGPPEPPRPAAPPAQQHAPPAAAFVHAKPGESNGLALTAMVLGIVGLALLLLSLGILFILTLPCSIAAWICAAQARARIAVGETAAGRGQAQAGYILGIVGVVLGVMAMVGWIAAIASGLDVEELRRDLERQSNPDSVQALLSLIGR